MRQRAKLVPEPTAFELVIAYILMYVKLPVTFYPFGHMARLLCEESHDVFYFLQWGALTLVTLVLPVLGSIMLPGFFVSRIRGRMTKTRFMVLRIVSLWMLLGSALSLVNQIFLKGVLNTPIRILMAPIAPVTQGATAIVVSIVMLICGWIVWSMTSETKKERCPHCGGYDYKNDRVVPGTRQEKKLGGKTVTTSEVEWRDVEDYGFGARVTDHVKETTTTTGRYAYQEKRRLTCCYCEWDFGVRDNSGEYTTEGVSTARHQDTRYY